MRRGAALVLALAILASLLFLALPFVFSQTASVGGARSAAWDHEARRILAASEHEAVAASISALAALAAGEATNSLPHDLAERAGYSVVVEHPGRAVLSNLPASGSTQRGLAIEDEYGKLDVNSLGPEAWGRLLADLDIPDPTTWRWVWSGGQPNAQPALLQHGSWQPLPYGRLAIALARHRLRLPSGRYHDLAELLAADPRRAQPAQAPFGAVEYGSGARDQESFEPLISRLIPDWEQQLFGAGGLLDRQGPYRAHPLTRVEWERLLPHLTVHALGQGRAGCADLGTVIALSQVPNHNDHSMISDLVAAPAALNRLVPAFAWLVGARRDGRLYRGRRHLDGLTVESVASPLADPGLPLAVELPAWVNANTMTEPVAAALNAQLPKQPLAALAALPPDSWWPFALANTGQPSTWRPPLAVLSLGAVRIEAATTVMAAGQITAQRQRRSVWQALPASVERRWRSQAELEALCRLGLPSGSVSGPQPLLRRSVPGELLAGDGWLEPAPLASFADNPALSLPQRANLPADEGLVPAGYQRAFSAPLASLCLLRSGSDEFAPQQLSLRFALDGEASAAAVLFAARTGDGSAPRGRWRLRWEGAGAEAERWQGQLVLEVAGLALPWERDHPWTMAADDPRTADIDERCLPGPLSLAPRRPGPPHEEFRYRAELARGTIHHLQLWYAGPQPGQYGLAVDGIVGRDAISGRDFARFGDHYPFPALRLAEDIPASDPLREGGAALSRPERIRLLAPPGLRLAELLPARGLIRIDDEYFSYEGIDGDALRGVRRGRRQNCNPTAVIRTLVRPGPPAEYRDDPDHAKRWPATQAHRAGALVLPGDWLTRIEAGVDADRRWLRGATTLADPLQAEAVTEEIDIRSWPVVNGQRLYPSEIPVRGPWPERGILRFEVNVSENKAAFVREGERLRLDWRPPIASGTPEGAAPLMPPAFTSRASVTIRLISLRVADDADLTHTPTAERLRFARSGWLQLLDPQSGRCEWVRYDDLAVREPPCQVTGRFFIHEQGWDMAPFATPQPAAQPRGAWRTPWRRDSPWPAGTRVLPVQTLLPDVRGLESGDVCTVVADRAPLPWPPLQLIVRHAASDGLPWTSSETGFEAPASFFALTEAVPDGIPDATLRDQSNRLLPQPAGAATILVGRGWRGADLSPVHPVQTRRGQGPRASAWGAQATLAIGGPGLLVDDIASGPLLSGLLGDAASENGCRVVALSGDRDQPVEIAGEGARGFPLRVQSNAEVFTRPYGIIDIGGEVFAYRRFDARHADLIGRALLGSAARAQGLPSLAERGRGVASPDSPFHGLPLIPLPFGPVGELMGEGLLLPATASATALGTRGALGEDLELCDRPYDEHRSAALPANPAQRSPYEPSPLRAPVQLLHHPHDGSAEVLRFLRHPDLEQVLTAPWLRGLYGTAPQAWQGAFGLARRRSWRDPLPDWQPPPLGSGRLNPLVIGWWPSRPAPLADLGLADRDRHAQLRCRLYGWFAYGLQCYGLRPLQAEVEVLSLGGAEALAARLLVPGGSGLELSDWGAMPEELLAEGKHTFGFGHARQRAGGAGCELRLHWLPASAQGSWAERWSANQGLRPRLGAVALRAQAAVQTLAVEAVR
ncbi:MAG: hypothetical protein RMM29_01760 [Planctomycetota bacterium]|nr:hypothetical protein [Planctomycetota bacterium]